VANHHRDNVQESLTLLAALKVKTPRRNLVVTRAWQLRHVINHQARQQRARQSKLPQKVEVQ